MFLPKWATIFEHVQLRNCEDPSCYKDFVRTRAVSYLTWENVSKLYAPDGVGLFF